MKFFNSKKILLLISVLYFFSLLAPAIITSSGEEIYGIKILIAGWISFMVLSPAWLANITFIYTLKNSDKFSGLISAFITVILGLSSVLIINKNIPQSSFGVVVGFTFGFYLWIISFVSLFFVTLKNYFRN
jgi:hypothetical protein